nr:hypothetical protein [Mucilaginibacter sp. X5P1]
MHYFNIFLVKFGINDKQLIADQIKQNPGVLIPEFCFLYSTIFPRWY